MEQGEYIPGNSGTVFYVTLEAKEGSLTGTVYDTFKLENIVVSDPAAQPVECNTSYTANVTLQGEVPQFDFSVAAPSYIVKPGSTSTITVSVSNNVTVDGLQMVFATPEGNGVSYVKRSDKNSDRLVAGSRVTANVRPNNNISFLLGNIKTGYILEKGEGDVFTFDIAFDDNFTAPEVTIPVKEGMLSVGASGFELNTPALTYKNAKVPYDAITTGINGLTESLTAALAEIAEKCPNVKDNFIGAEITEAIANLKGKADAAYNDLTIFDQESALQNEVTAIQGQIDALVKDAEAAQKAYDDNQARLAANQVAYDADVAAINKLQEDADAKFAELEEKYPSFNTETAKGEVANLISDMLKAASDELAAKQEAGNYESKVNAEAVDQVIADAEEAAKANQEAVAAKYAELTAELAGYQESLDAAKEQIEKWGLTDEYTPDIEAVQNQINAAKENLENRNNNNELTPDSELSDKTIGKAIDNLSLEAARTYADAEIQKAIDAVAAVDLSGDYVNKDELVNTKDNLKAQANALKDEAEDAAYERLTEIAAAAADIVAQAEALAENAKANAYVPGDVTLDSTGEVDVFDVQLLASWIAKGTTWSELYAENSRQAMAADLTGDETLNVTDLAQMIALALGETDAAMMKAPAFHGGSYTVGMSVMPISASTRLYAVEISNDMDLIAGQIDFTATGDAVIESIEAADRLSDHNIETARWEDGTVRAVVYSLSNAKLTGNGGSVLLVKVSGEGELNLSNAIFAGSDLAEYELVNAGTTAVKGIYMEDYDYDAAIYNAAGVRFGKTQNGINIIRNGDGTVTKKIVRK